MKLTNQSGLEGWFLHNTRKKKLLSFRPRLNFLSRKDKVDIFKEFSFLSLMWILSFGSIAPYSNRAGLLVVLLPGTLLYLMKLYQQTISWGVRK